MKERPILFSGPMVRALLDGSKTQTRRVCKPALNMSAVIGIQDPRDFGQCPLHIPGSGWFGDEDGDVQFFSPYGKPGDRLWVRETWNSSANVRPPIGEPYIYAADLGPTGVMKWAATWKPSIHMPRAASRITLEVSSVRVEHLQDISEADALAEGITRLGDDGFGLPDGRHFHSADPRISYLSLWESINGDGSVEANPWAWVVEFKRIAA